MRYDTCVKRGTVRKALTDFQQGGATWYVRGDLAVDSGSTRLYGAKSEITSDDHPVPDYHFATGQVKWLNKNVMVARPAVLYVHDVPIMWLPFIFNDIRDRKSTRLNSSHGYISYAVFCLKKKKTTSYVVIHKVDIIHTYG